MSLFSGGEWTANPAETATSQPEEFPNSSQTVGQAPASSERNSPALSSAQASEVEGREEVNEGKGDDDVAALDVSDYVLTINEDARGKMNRVLLCQPPQVIPSSGAGIDARRLKSQLNFVGDSGVIGRLKAPEDSSSHAWIMDLKGSVYTCSMRPTHSAWIVSLDTEKEKGGGGHKNQAVIEQQIDSVVDMTLLTSLFDREKVVEGDVSWLAEESVPEGLLGGGESSSSSGDEKTGGANNKNGAKKRKQPAKSSLDSKTERGSGKDGKMVEKMKTLARKGSSTSIGGGGAKRKNKSANSGKGKRSKV